MSALNNEGFGTVNRGFYPELIDNSLRFDGAADLTRTPSVAGNRKTFTWSGWVKRSELGAVQYIFGANINPTNSDAFRFTASDNLQFFTNGGTSSTFLTSDRVFRDPAAWLHIVLSVDTTQATPSDRVNIYINNSLISQFSSETYAPLDQENDINNSSTPHYIGVNPFSGVGDNIKAYLSKVRFVDGLALDPTSFGEFKNNVWVHKEYAGAYGTNGFALDFDGTTTDSSGNGNDWTATGIAASDYTTDTPTNKHCTLDPLDTRTTGTLSDGNLIVAGGNAAVTMRPTSGQLYYEKDGVGVSYDCDVSGQFDPVLTAGSYNFGQLPWADTGPTGTEKSVCAANLPETTISPNGATQVDDYYGAVEDTESNIAASVAALRTGWPNYFELMKNLSSVETWAWRFSHDSGNEYAVSTTATYQAERALSGTDSWIGYTVKIDPACGTAAGEQAHTSGTPTTITHNLGETRGFILLFPRAGGAVYAYHPDLPAGHLLVLTSTAVSSANTTITNVTANSFDIGSGVTTGTYDYLIMTEVDGFFDLSTHEGNGSTDGAFSYGDRAAFGIIKNIDALGDHVVVDSVRVGYNVDNNPIYLNLANAQATTDLVDIVSNGLKFRSTDQDVNSLHTFVTARITEQPIKYSNAR